MKKTIQIIVLIFIPLLQFSQTPIYEHYSVEDGLPSAEIYAQLEDKSGYMWFATSKGVARFDGHEFKTYTVNDGLPSNSVIKLFQDYEGKVWFSHYSGHLSYYQNEKITAHPKNDTIIKLSKNYFIDYIHLDTLNRLWLMPSMGGIYRIDSNSVNNLYDSIVKRNNADFIFKDIGNGFIWTTVFNDKSNAINNEFEIFAQHDSYYFNLPENLKSMRRNFLKTTMEQYFFSYANLLIEIDHGKIVQRTLFENDISNIFYDYKGNLWVSVMYEGIYYFEDADFRKAPVQFLAGKSPAMVLQDREGNYWFPTTEDGVYFLPSLQFNSYSQFGFSNYNILAIEAYNNHLFFSTYDKQLFKCELESKQIKYIENLQIPGKRHSAILDILKPSEQNTWYVSDYLMIEHDGVLKQYDKLHRSYQLSKGADSTVLVTLQGGYCRYRKHEKIFESYNNYPALTISIYEDDKNTIWLGTIDGLYAYKDGAFEYWGRLNSLLKSRIDDIKEYKQFKCFATRGNGLILLNNDNVYQITENKGLTSNFINKIHVDGDSVLWLATNKGLSKLVITDTVDFKYKIDKYSRSDGLFSEEIKDITRNDDCIWLGTSRGLISFKPKQLEKYQKAPKLLIDSIKINDSKAKFLNQYYLKHNENNITIYFKSIYFKSPQSVRYKYQLTGFDNKWLITSDRFVRFPNLQPGSYTFSIVSAGENQVWNTEPIIINFYIEKHFTQTILFSILLYLFFAALLALIGYYIFKNLKNKIDTERRLLFAEQKALRSQMNPHFMFNSLNSIRSYILVNDSEKADEYLTSFAILMRRVLENSKHNFISLQQEIDTLKLYLQLERMRFDESFTFDIKLSRNLNVSEIKIPPMLIQPYLENAIWHGLVPKKQNGELLLLFKKIESVLLVVVEDNGIGRRRSAQIKRRRKNHKSTGQANVDERIYLLNKQLGSNIILKIIDLYDNNDKAKGTRVEIKIPISDFN